VSGESEEDAGFLGSVRKKVVALTGVVVALGGLLAAIQTLIPKNEPSKSTGKSSEQTPPLAISTAVSSTPTVVLRPTPATTNPVAIVTPVSTPVQSSTPTPESTAREQDLKTLLGTPSELKTTTTKGSTTRPPRVEDLPPEQQEAWHLDSAARSLFDKRDYQGAIRDYTRSIALRPLGETYADRAQAYSDIKQYDNAISDLTEAIRLDSPDGDQRPYAYHYRGLSYRAIGNSDQARADLEKAPWITAK
jgi:tetratricopeptide (TPR) repeat protein